MPQIVLIDTIRLCYHIINMTKELRRQAGLAIVGSGAAARGVPSCAHPSELALTQAQSREPGMARVQRLLHTVWAKNPRARHSCQASCELEAKPKTGFHDKR